MANTSITITAPANARKGEKVTASVTVKNFSYYPYAFRGDIQVLPDNYAEYTVSSIDQAIASGSSVTRNVSFTMPDCNVTIFIWLERWAATYWAYDSSASKVVALEAAVPTIYHLSVLVPSWAVGGSVSPGSGDYTANTTVALKATPLSGYRFVGWGGDASGTNTTYSLLMNGNKSVEAYFEKIPAMVGWILIGTKPLSIERAEEPVAGWLTIDSVSLSVTRLSDGIPPDEEEPEEPSGEGFPVGAVLIGAGVLMLLGSAVIKEKPKTPEKKPRAA